ncbi:MAG: hydroxymethylglutaryl-CoA lyase [Chthoniobacterales bacterium]
MKEVKIIECPRDAWQGLPRQIPIETKVLYLRALIDAGFRHIDAASFVSPQAVPQMADSETVLEQLAPPNTVEIIGIVVNEKGAERAIATGVISTLGYPCSISPTFLRRNQNQSPEENLTVLENIQKRARENGLEVVAYVSMAFGNPYDDPWSEERLIEMSAAITGLDICSISLADTVGVATPELISKTVAAVMRQCGSYDIGVHMHSERGEAEAKVLAAYDAGCRRFDAAMGGIGGCPFAQDRLVGNIATEEVLQALTKRGVQSALSRKLENVAILNAEISRDFSA